MPPAHDPLRPSGEGEGEGPWTELWPAPPSSRAWADLGQDARQALLVQDWHARWPDTPFPVARTGCPVCRRLRGARAALEGSGGPGRPNPDPAQAADDHGSLHALLAHELVALWGSRTGAGPVAQAERIRAAFGAPVAAAALLTEPALAPFASAAWDAADGRRLLREPVATAGSTERSKAFLLLHRHRFGRFVGATMRDYQQSWRRPEPAPGSLRLYDDGGHVLELGAMTAGYRGEGPRGTVWAVRVAGLPDGARDSSGQTELERTVFGRRTFLWPSDGR